MIANSPAQLKWNGGKRPTLPARPSSPGLFNVTGAPDGSNWRGERHPSIQAAAAPKPAPPGQTCVGKGFQAAQSGSNQDGSDTGFVDSRHDDNGYGEA